LAATIAARAGGLDASHHQGRVDSAAAMTTTALNIGLIHAVCLAGIALGGVTLLHERMTGAQRAAAVAWAAYSVLLPRWRSVLGSERLTAIVVGGLVVSLPFTLVAVA
jgi:hypothetical protein